MVCCVCFLCACCFLFLFLFVFAFCFFVFCLDSNLFARLKGKTSQIEAQRPKTPESAQAIDAFPGDEELNGKRTQREDLSGRKRVCVCVCVGGCR